MKFHVISHTHWDREWHQTYQQYRVKLVRFIDELLELLETRPDYHSFLLDGQTIVLEDYLEVKPQNEERIAKLIKDERIIVGPWYIQPDEFIPSGESLIRNLLIGQQIAHKFGPSMELGYLPDSFGQAAQIPQVLSGFGIKNALFWRGMTNEETNKTDFYWEGPDGSKVLTTNLALGYGNARLLSKDHDENIKIVDENFDALQDKATTGNILLMSGFDQRTANPDLPEIITELNKHYLENSIPFEVQFSRLEDYFEGLLEGMDELETLSGEFRKGKDMRVHVSIASTRMDIKKQNFEVQNLFEKYVEPLNSVSFLFGGVYDNDIINQGWKYMMQNHAHDSICNVCTDDTHREMVIRYDAAEQIGETVRGLAIDDVIRNVKFKENKGNPLVIFNTLGSTRKGLAETTLHLKSRNFSMYDQNGEEVPFQVLEQTEENLNDKQIEIGVKNSDQFVFTTKIKFLAEVDGFGFTTYYVKENAPSSQQVFADVYQNGTFTNDHLELKVEENGSLTVKERKTGAIFEGLNILEEGGNAGDEYDFSPPREDVVITTEKAKPEITVVQNGPLVSTVKIAYELAFPVDTTVDSRSEEMQRSFFDTYVTVNRYENRVDIKTVIDNTVKNHRVRALFETGKTVKTHVADQQFGTIRRDNYLKQVEYWEQENWGEKYYPIYPQQKFVDVSDEESGLGIINKGLPQYEILNASKPTVALTLLATTDYMGKQDLVDRPGRRSGLHVETPDSLMLGVYEMEYAVVPHAGNEIDAQIGNRSLEFMTPFVAVPVAQAGDAGTIDDNHTFIQINEPNIAISAMKKSEVDNSLIVRIYNTTNQSIDAASVSFNQDFFKAIGLVDLNESKIQADDRFTVMDNQVHLTAIRSNEIINLKLS